MGKKDKSKKNKKSRKRKRPSPSSGDDNENDGDNETEDKPPKKKRKTNSGKSIVDKGEDEGDSAQSESNNNKKDQKKGSKKKKSEPGMYTLSKLKKILRAIGAANPKVYKNLKGKSNKKQILMIKEILTEKEVDFSNLSEKAIKKLKAEWNLKREMAELGIDTSKQNEDGQEEDDKSLSSRRPRRNRNKVVSYRP